MMEDEIISSLRDTFPLTEETLTTVMNHVTESNDTVCSKKIDVHLRFVFGPDQSLDKFIQVLYYFQCKAVLKKDNIHLLE